MKDQGFDIEKYAKEAIDKNWDRMILLTGERGVGMSTGIFKFHEGGSR